MKKLMKRIAPVFYAVCMVFTSMATPLLTLPVHAADVNEQSVEPETDAPVVKDDSSTGNTQVPEEQPSVKDEDSQQAGEILDTTEGNETNDNTAAPKTGDANTNDEAQNLLGGAKAERLL